MKPSVLILDDEKVICEGLARVLSDKYRTFQALSGREAIDIIMSNDIDVLLCDIIMPGMSGSEVIKAIRSANKDIRVIVITAFSDPLNVCEAMRYGANNFMLKPLNIPLLEKAIQNAVKNKSKGK